LNTQIFEGRKWRRDDVRKNIWMIREMNAFERMMRKETGGKMHVNAQTKQRISNKELNKEGKKRENMGKGRLFILKA